MTADEMYQKFYELGIIPVVVLNDAKDAKPLGQAMIDGGLPVAEVTFRTDAAEESIKILSEEYPDMLVGAGTVLTTEQVDRAVAAGAKFIVSPGLNPDVVSYCMGLGIPICPGVVTPGEIEKGLALGLNVLKFFPAEPAGGLKMINAMGAAYTTVKFMPTGGINATNVVDYLNSPRILACGGSWMVKGNLIDAGEFDKITDLCKEAAQIVKDIRG